MPLTKKFAAQSADSTKVLQFLGAAFDDYLAARVLLRSRLPIQGAVLASTAVEKYCKTVLAFRGNESHGHLKRAHWKCLSNFDPEVYRTFNEQFFEMLQKAYDLRYPDSLPRGYNIVIKSRELLAELDYVAMTLNPRFNVARHDGRPSQTSFDQALARGDSRLIDENHALRGENRQAFIAAENEVVYESLRCGFVQRQERRRTKTFVQRRSCAARAPSSYRCPARRPA